MKYWLGFAFLCGAAGVALAQTSQLETPTGVTPAELQAVQAQIPQPATVVPPSEMPGGTVGDPGTYRPANARQPRITRSATLTLAADGTGTFNWSAQGALAGPDVQVVVTPVYTGTGVAKCWATTASATSASVKCVIESITLLSILGLNVGSVTNTAPASMKVGVVVLPTS